MRPGVNDKRPEGKPFDVAGRLDRSKGGLGVAFGADFQQLDMGRLGLGDEAGEVGGWDARLSVPSAAKELLDRDMGLLGLCDEAGVCARGESQLSAPPPRIGVDALGRIMAQDDEGLEGLEKADARRGLNPF